MFSRHSATEEAPVPYWRLSSFYFFYFAMLGAWVPYWSLFLKELGFGAVDIGYLTGILMATKIVAPSLWGWLADRAEHRMPIIRFGSLMAFICILGIFFDKSFWWLAAVVAGYSFFWNAVLAQFEVVTLSHLQGRHNRYSLIRVWGSIGFILAVGGLGWLFDRLSVIYLAEVFAGLLGLIWLSSLIVSERPMPKHRDGSLKGLFAVIRKPPVLAFFIICFLLQIAHGPYYTFFSIYAENHGYSRVTIGMFWSLGVAAEVLLFTVMHRVLSRYTIRQILLVSLLLAALRWVMIGYLIESLWWLLLAQCLHAATFGAFHAIAIETMRRFFGGGLEGQGQAFYSGFSFGAGGALGAVLSGWLWDWSPVSTFVMASAASLLALVIGWIWVRGTELQ